MLDFGSHGQKGTYILEVESNRYFTFYAVRFVEELAHEFGVG